MKARWFLFLLVVLLVPALAACTAMPIAAPAGEAEATESTQAAGSEPTTIRWGIYADPGRQAAAEKQVAAFKAMHPEIDVKIEAAPFAEYYDKMSAQIASGTLYDVFMMSGANFQNFAPKGAFEDLTPYLQQAEIALDDYTMEPENSTHDDKIMAVPYELDIQALFYNKDLFDQAGVAYPTADWTWDDLLAAAQALTVKDDQGNTQQWGFFSQNLYPSYVSFIAQNGGSVLSEDRTHCTLNSPEAIEAIQFMVDLIHEYGVSPAPGDLPEGVDPFQTGAVAMTIDGSYSVNPKLEVGFNWGVAPLPKQKQPGAAYWTQAIAMHSSSEHKDAAWTFIQFLLSDEGQRIMAETKMAAPSKKEIASSDVYLSAPPEGMDTFVDSYEFGQTLQFTPQWFQIMAGSTSAIAREFDPVWLGQTPVEDAVNRACQEIDKILAGS